MTTVHGGNGCKHSSLTVFHRLNDVVAQSLMTMEETAGLVGTFCSFGVAHSERPQIRKEPDATVGSKYRTALCETLVPKDVCLLPDATDC